MEITYLTKSERKTFLMNGFASKLTLNHPSSID